ncbi:MAG: 23S rRNA (adenine(2030)-N(6))-methyltransferase RlmJ [Chroococcidiopsidaceae cyanobacterium CP_BM_ER_R8_30]|nr:23S rRNA (adenine(2030)-N(6))-methyltransferase RlmJ [Chroococcidiopsidaceae cyanobacterium CP_BM_ER_R8_30]
MANQHFATIGDIWKHLPLAEILTIERPSKVWESHAGSAQYPLTYSWKREYGAYHFLKHAQESLPLAQSQYNAILQHLASTKDNKALFPGSPRLAMSLLGDRMQYLYCDLDWESLETIKVCARELGVASEHVETVCAEGIAVLYERLLILDVNNALSVLALLDPFDPFKHNEHGYNSIDLFRDLTARGVKAALWYGFDSLTGNESETHSTSRAGRHEQLRRVLHIQEEDDPTLSNKLWCGEIFLKEIERLQFRVNPSVLGCGFLCANLSSESVRACELLAMGLVEIYQNSRLPGGSSGTLRFETVQF